MATHSVGALRTPSGRLRKRSLLINAVIFAGVLYLLGWQFRGLSGSIDALRHAEVRFMLAALAAVTVSYIAAALSYQSLSLRPVRFAETMTVQIASGFTNRLLPAGFGSLGLYAAYLRKRGHALATASALVATNNLLGIVGNCILLVGVLLIRPEYISQLHVARPPRALLSVIAGVMIVLGLLFVVRADLARRLLSFLGSTFNALRSNVRPDSRTARALICNMAVTGLSVLALSWSVSAAHATLDWPAALLVLSFGTFIGAAVPTPGGIGGVEAGLLAGMTAFGVPVAAGLAAVLLYRSLTFWLPILPGLVAFRLIEKRFLWVGR